MHYWFDWCLLCGKSVEKRNAVAIRAGGIYDTKRLGFLCQDCFPNFLDYLGAVMPPEKHREPFLTEDEIQKELEKRKL